MIQNDLTLQQAGDDLYLTLDCGASTTYKVGAIKFQHGSVDRWALEKDDVANADMYIRRYNSSGVLQDSPLKIAGDTGNITLTQTGTLSLQYDANNRVDTTVSSAGAIKLTAVGSSDSFEIETGDGKIILDAKDDIDLDPEGNDINLLGAAAGKITLAAASITMYGGDTTGDALVLQGNSADAGQKITITGATGITLTGALTMEGNSTAGLTSAATYTNFIDLTSMASVTNLFKFNAVAGALIANALVPAAAPDAGTMGADACLRVLINATPYYIPLYDTLHA